MHEGQSTLHGKSSSLDQFVQCHQCPESLVVHSKNERFDLFELIGHITVKFHDSLFDLQLLLFQSLAEVEFAGMDPNDIGRECAFEVVLSSGKVHNCSKVNAFSY